MVTRVVDDAGLEFQVLAAVLLRLGNDPVLDVQIIQGKILGGVAGFPVKPQQTLVLVVTCLDVPIGDAGS